VPGIFLQYRKRLSERIIVVLSLQMPSDACGAKTIIFRNTSDASNAGIGGAMRIHKIKPIL
jgi:hypothetical protein